MIAAAAVALIIQLGTTGSASLDHLSISYQLTGPFGAVTDFVRTRPGVSGYSIPLAYEGTPADSVKVIVVSPTSRFVLLERDPETVETSEPITVTLDPQRMVAVPGKIVTPIDPAGLQVEARYVAPWAMDFFGYLDGPVPTFDLGTVPLEKDGTFRITLPDLSQDPVVRSRDDRREPSTFELTVRDAKSRNIRYRLTPESGGPLRARDALPEAIRCVAR